MPNIIPAKAEVVVVVGIDTQPQQHVFDAGARETTTGILIIAIGEIPEKIVAVPIAVAYNLTYAIDIGNLFPNHNGG